MREPTPFLTLHHNFIVKLKPFIEKLTLYLNNYPIFITQLKPLTKQSDLASLFFCGFWCVKCIAFSRNRKI